jgi:ATP-dependent exoDNAse (exonuclease V) alpha subunit
MGRIHSEPGRAEAIDRLMRDWKAVGRADDSLILTHTRSAAAELNSRVQQARLDRGELSGPGMKLGDGVLYRNDVVRFTANDSRLGVVNGEKGRVVAALPMAIAIATKTRTVILPRSRADEVLSLGYASTTHASQGQTTDLAFVLVEGPIRDESLAYVQLSRARGVTRLYVDEESVGEQLVTVAREAHDRNRQALDFARRMDPAHAASIRDDVSRSNGRGR